MKSNKNWDSHDWVIFVFAVYFFIVFFSVCILGFNNTNSVLHNPTPTLMERDE